MFGSTAGEALPAVPPIGCEALPGVPPAGGLPPLFCAGGVGAALCPPCAALAGDGSGPPGVIGRGSTPWFDEFSLVFLGSEPLPSVRALAHAHKSNQPAPKLHRAIFLPRIPSSSEPICAEKRFAQHRRLMSAGSMPDRPAWVSPPPRSDQHRNPDADHPRQSARVRVHSGRMSGLLSAAAASNTSNRRTRDACHTLAPASRRSSNSLRARPSQRNAHAQRRL